MRLPILALLSLVSVAAPAAEGSRACVAEDSLTVVSVPESLRHVPRPLQAGDVLVAWRDADSVERSLCSLLDLAEAELERGTLAPIELTVRRADRNVAARLTGSRHEIAWQQRGDTPDAQAARGLLQLRTHALRGEFVAARERVGALSSLPSVRRALALELALGWLEADPDRAAAFAIADEIVALRKAAPKREQARALALRGRAWLLRRDLKSAQADAAAAEALLGDEASLITAQLRLLQGALGYLTSQHDAAEHRYREAIALIDRIAPDGLAEANALSNLAALEVARGQPAQAFEHYDAALALLATAAPRSYSEARVLFNRALASTELRRLADAERDIAATIERFAIVQPDGPEHVLAQAQLADVYNARGQHALAEARLRELLPRLQARAPQEYNTLAVEYTLALTFARLQRRDESLAAFRVLLDKLAVDRPDSLRIDTLNAYAQVLSETDALEPAVAALTEAIEGYEARQRRGLPMASALIARGDSLRRLGRLDPAQADLDQALKLRATLAPGSVLEAVAHHLLGKLDRARGDVDAALTRYHRAIELLERERWLQSESAELRALWTASYADFYREPLDLLLELGRLPQAFELDQRYRGRELAFALAQPGAGLDATLVPERTLPVDEAQRLLGKDRAVLSFVTLPTHSWALLLDARGIEARRLAHGKPHWRAEVDALSVLWALPQSTPISERAAIERSHRLERELFAPWGDRLAQLPRLLLVPDDALHELAFAALVTESAERAVDARYLAERHALSTVLRPLGNDTAPALDPAMLALGDPVATTRPSAAMPLRGADLVALPAARREAEAVAALYGSNARALLGSDAIETAVANSNAGVLHFATHIVLDPLQPLDSYVRLAPSPGSDGRLSAREIAALPRVPRAIVVLAGCASAQGANAAGEGLLGIARAWLVTGAQQVLASNWAIADEPTERFMIDFHRALRTPRDGDLALAETQRDWLTRSRASGWWRRDRSDEARPFFWAGFSLAAARP
jgi:CHAT domain-containing protein